MSKESNEPGDLKVRTVCNLAPRWGLVTRALIAAGTAGGLLVATPVRAQCAPEWSLRAESGPDARRDHAMTYDIDRGMALMHGGASGSPNEYDLWGWNGVFWTRLPGVLFRDSHAIVYDERRHLVIAFGGYDLEGLEPSRETWAHDGSGWRFVTESGPRGRASHAMVYDSRRGVTVLFGGGDPNLLGDTWELSTSGWRRVATTGPSRRRNHAMAYDRNRGVTVLHGGQGDLIGETWEWDGNEWRLVSTKGPGPAEGHAMVYDTHRRRMVMVGAYSDLQTWEWNGQEWTLAHRDFEMRRFRHAMAFDEQRGRLVLFGGFANGRGYLSDTWEYGPPNPFLYIDATCPAGGPVSIRWTCATANRSGALLLSPRHGVFSIPPNHPCTGTTLDLDANGLRVVWTGSTGPEGRGAINAEAGPAVCGSFLQFLDINTCRTSAAVIVR